MCAGEGEVGGVVVVVVAVGMEGGWGGRGR